MNPHIMLEQKKRQEAPITDLTMLVTLDRLEVGPAKIEKDRIRTPYRVVSGSHSDTIELIYRYEEPVFDETEPESQNLANLITAQVALNYGLFCKSIVFNGLFDKADQQFLSQMAENTAREIYVKKFLEHNPFICKGAILLPAVRHDRYLQAELVFPGTCSRSGRLKPWKVERDRHAILSSGGKDSLLSYGLLNETGRKTYQIFLNESGRHWFTALNAYRYFRDNTPQTSRVWLNSDRVFSWMLRHFPFIRPDFADLRSDEYAVRLWTVAVFLFGALPLMRRHRIGRLIIGDEYDTTRRVSFRGIPHYDGLYDQSRYFDNALSRFFNRKDWSIAQFSIVRPLSELLIEKILCHRYPALQAQQMSCHMTHTEGNRVYPCGRCEKCRRIAGMLLAVGGDPTLCGYKKEQIDFVKKTIGVRHIHQESRGVSQLLHMLLEKSVIELPSQFKKRIREYPEILKVRFDSESSPVYAIPDELREPLYRIYRSHANGAVRQNGRDWVEFDPLSDPDFTKPYRYERKERG